MDMSQRTIVNIVDNPRELCVKFYRDHAIQLGGDGRVVEALMRVLKSASMQLNFCSS